jgi:V/A-type H+-transporting ATPase subunit I
MALLDMKRLTLIAHAQSKHSILKTLQDLGAVEIISADLTDLHAAGASQSLGLLELRLADVRKSLELIKKYDETKTSFLTPKPAISASALKNMDYTAADEAISELNALTEETNTLKSRKQRLKNRISQLEPYECFDAPLESLGKNTFSVFLLGAVPTGSAEEYARIRESYADCAYFEAVGESRESVSVFVAVHSSEAEKLLGELKYIGFSEAYTKDSRGTPADIMRDLDGECAAIDNKAAENEQKVKKFVDDKLLLQAVEDHLINDIERERSIEKLGETGVAFLLEGWIIADDEERVHKALIETAPEAYITTRKPAQDEIPPTAIRNKKLVQPFEAVVDMYSAPSSRGLDPNFVMSIFYFFIFGMMIGDAAYGIILIVGAYIVLKLKKPTGMFRKVTTIIMICGISTAFWGLMFGSVFSIDGIKGIFNPLGNPMPLLILCLGVGVVHLLAGLGVAAYMNIRRGKILDAIFDNVSWMKIGRASCRERV